MISLQEELCSKSRKTSLAISAYETHLYDALNKLSEKERSAIFLRFWVPCSIQEIAKHFQVSWTQADQILEKAIEKIKNEFRLNKLIP